MAAKIETSFGTAIPPQPRHAITVHLPKWDSFCRFANRDPEVMGAIKSMYPRMFLHADVKELIKTFLQAAGVDPQTHSCSPYTSVVAASDCVAFASSSTRGKEAVPLSDISIKVIDLDIRYWVVFFPLSGLPTLHTFWIHSGLGTSSRQAEKSLEHLSSLRIIEHAAANPRPKSEKNQAHLVIQKRIASLLERAPVGPPRVTKVEADDVYLFQTGMAAIYCLHTWLLNTFKGKQQSVLFGFAFHHTINVFNLFGPGYKFSGKGGESDIEELEEWLKNERKEGRKVQALWAEFPSNPLIVTPNLRKLGELADEYGFLIIADETIGSFCNVDVLGVADVVISSLTKSFSGYADVMGASAVVNPSSSRYAELKRLFKQNFLDEYSGEDAVQLEKNSRNYLERSTILNNNALKLVEYFQTLAADPESCVSGVFYTTIGPSLENYKDMMRPPTDEFTPGYGCLFTVEFKQLEQTISFFDNLNVHQGPHLGAHLTLAIPYVRTLYSKELDWAAKYNMRPTQVRIAVGLEDTEVLLKTFKIAVRAAEEVAIGKGEGA